jgi:hypothetical protein
MIIPQAEHKGVSYEHRSQRRRPLSSYRRPRYWQGSSEVFGEAQKPIHISPVIMDDCTDLHFMEQSPATEQSGLYI